MGKSRSASSPPRNLLSTLLPALAAFALAVLSLAGCGDDGDDPPEITVSPASVMLAKGTTSTVSAKVDGRNASSAVSWKTSDPNVATVVEGDGGTAQITAVNAGEARITVTLEKSTAQVLVTVGEAVVESIAITPPAPTVAAGTATDLAATATLSDKTTRNVTAQVQWSTSDAGKAMVSPAGRLSGLVKGAATITATLGTLKAMAAVTITDAALVSIAVTPVNVSLPKGRTRQMTATGTFSDSSTQDLTATATWASSVITHATVSNADGSRGVVTAAGVGDAMISATLNGVTGQVAVSVTAAVLQSIALTPAAPSLAKGLTLSFTATGTYSDATTQDLSASAAWMSSNVAAATTSGRLVTAVAPGDATISATLDGITGTTALTVTAAAVVSLQVTPAATSIAKGLTRQFTATGLLSDGTNANVTDQVLWTSSDATLASISNAAGSRGLATAIGVGSATITASINGVGGNVTGSTTLEVTDAELVSIAVTPATFSLALGRTQQLVATGTYTDATTTNLTTQVTWSSSADAIATISNADGTRGLVTALTTGGADFTATMNSITSNTAHVTVTDASLVSIAVTPATGTLPVGRTQQYTAIGTFSDATTDDLTALVTWSSSDSAMLAISNAAGSQGLATALAPGDVTVSATLDGITGTAAVTVVAVTLQSISVTPATSSLIVGRTQQLTATGSYNDGSTLDITTQVTWTSSDDTHATISNVDGSRGVVTGVAVGAATLTATMGAITGTAAVDVIGITSIAVAPATITLDAGATQQLTATATLSTGTTLDITTSAVWLSSNTGVATVSNADGTRGVVTAVAGGNATISASEAGATGTATIAVRQIVSIAIGSVGDVSRGTGRQLTATATLSDATTADVTAQATWTSSDPAAMTVGDTATTKGQIFGITSAGATITATVAGVTGSLDIAGCKLVINELQTQGLNANGSTNAGDEWVEIASTCTTTQPLTNLRIVYRAAAATSGDNTVFNLTGTIAPNDYLFFVNSGVAGNYTGETGTFGTGISATGGGFAIRVIGGAIIDSMGFGVTANAFIEGTPAAAPSTTQSVARVPNRQDTDSNSVDFALRTGTARTPGAANP